MTSPYWIKHRQKLFPKINDWRLEASEHIKGKTFKALTQQEFFWFDPDSYKLQYYGLNVFSIFIFLLMGFYFAFRGVWVLAVFLFVPGAYFIINLIKKVKNRATIKTFTFYDLYLRDDYVE